MSMLYTNTILLLPMRTVSSISVNCGVCGYYDVPSHNANF